MKKNSRRSFLKKSTLAGLSVGLNKSVFAIKKNLKMDNLVVGHGNFKYTIDKNWGIQNFKKFPIDHCHEMVIDKKNRILMTTTHPKNNILIFDRSGKIKDSWSINYNGAHGLSILDEGDEEFLFITDPENHKVCKTSINGKKIFELNYPKEIKDYNSEKDFKPTETCIAPNGDIYVADGYGKDFIIRYDSNGNYIGHFGGKGDKNENFDCCHGITIDNRDKNNMTLLITSRSKNEFKRFTLDGIYKETISLPGCWICRPVIKGGNLFFAVIVTKSWDKYDGMLAVLDRNNKVVSLPGGNKPEYLKNVLTPPISDKKSFLNPHDVCIDEDENIYVPQWNSKKTYPLKLTRV